MRDFRDKNSLFWIISFIIVGIIFIIWLFFLPSFIKTLESGGSSNGDSWDSLGEEALNILNIFKEQKDILDNKILPQLESGTSDQVSISEDDLMELKDKVKELSAEKNNLINQEDE